METKPQRTQRHRVLYCREEYGDNRKNCNRPSLSLERRRIPVSPCLSFASASLRPLWLKINTLTLPDLENQT